VKDYIDVLKLENNFYKQKFNQLEETHSKGSDEFERILSLLKGSL